MWSQQNLITKVVVLVVALSLAMMIGGSREESSAQPEVRKDKAPAGAKHGLVVNPEGSPSINAPLSWGEGKDTTHHNMTVYWHDKSQRYIVMPVMAIKKESTGTRAVSVERDVVIAEMIGYPVGFERKVAEWLENEFKKDNSSVKKALKSPSIAPDQAVVQRLMCFDFTVTIEDRLFGYRVSPFRYLTKDEKRQEYSHAVPPSVRAVFTCPSPKDAEDLAQRMKSSKVALRSSFLVLGEKQVIKHQYKVLVADIHKQVWKSNFKDSSDPTIPRCLHVHQLGTAIDTAGLRIEEEFYVKHGVDPDLTQETREKIRKDAMEYLAEVFQKNHAELKEFKELIIGKESFQPDTIIKEHNKYAEAMSTFSRKSMDQFFEELKKIKTKDELRARVTSYKQAIEQAQSNYAFEAKAAFLGFGGSGGGSVANTTIHETTEALSNYLNKKWSNEEENQIRARLSTFSEEIMNRQASAELAWEGMRLVPKRVSLRRVQESVKDGTVSLESKNVEVQTIEFAITVDSSSDEVISIHAVLEELATAKSALKEVRQVKKDIEGLTGELKSLVTNVNRLSQHVSNYHTLFRIECLGTKTSWDVSRADSEDGKGDIGLLQHNGEQANQHFRFRPVGDLQYEIEPPYGPGLHLGFPDLKGNLKLQLLRDNRRARYQLHPVEKSGTTYYRIECVGAPEPLTILECSEGSINKLKAQVIRLAQKREDDKQLFKLVPVQQMNVEKFSVLKYERP